MPTSALTEIASFSFVGADIQARAFCPPAPAAGGLGFLRGPMARRGRPRKDGPRLPGGRLKRSTSPDDPGSDMALAHRAAAVGADNARDPRAGYPLGILLLRGEIDRAEHDAGLAYAGLRGIVYGSATPRSHLAQLVESLCHSGDMHGLSDDARENQEARCSNRLRDAVAYMLLDGRRGFDMIENLAVFEHLPDNPNAYMRRADHSALQAALGRLVSLWKIRRE